MKVSKKQLLILSIIAYSFIGCGGDSNSSLYTESNSSDIDSNKSPLEGKYETRDKSLDLSRERQIEVAKRISKQFLYSHPKVPGLSVSILYEDSSAVNFTYGCAKLKPNIEKNGTLSYETGDLDNCEIPLTPTHRFKVGSITKSAVARTLLDIDDENFYDFSIDDDITKYLPDSILSLGDFSGIKVKHLLQHTSGLPDIDFSSGTPEEIIERAMKKSRISDSGAVFKYNNLGYILAGQIIEYITQDSWQVRVKKTIDDSIGENDFILPQGGKDWIDTESNVSWLIGQANTLNDGNKSLITGYFYEDNTFIPSRDIPLDSIASSSGSMIGNTADVSRWVKSLSTNDTNLLSDDYFRDRVLDITAENYKDIYVDHTERNMGAGIYYDQSQNALWHVGSALGYKCMMIYSKNEKIALSSCVNSNTSVTDFTINMLNTLYPYREGSNSITH